MITGTSLFWNGNQIVVETAADVNFTSVTTGATKIDNSGVAVGSSTLSAAGLTILNGPSVTTTGINAGSKVITNVAEGAVNAASKEAINGSQLNTTNTNVTNLDNRVTTVEGDVARIDTTITNIAGDTTIINTDENGLGIRYARTNESTLAKSDAFAEGVGSTALGYKATSSGVNAIAAGRDTQARGESSIAMGAGAETGDALIAGSGLNAIAIGAGAKAIGSNAISIGTGNTVRGNNSGAIGDPNTIDATNSYALGNNNTIGSNAPGAAATDGAFVVGNGSTVNQGASGALVLGSGATISANVTNTMALGNGTSVGTNIGVAIGNGASVSSVNGVALGSGAAATGVTLANQAYLVGGAATGEVSVGAAGSERRITNVAAGALDTDAVNVAQLKAVDAQANAGWNLQANGGTAKNVAPGSTVEFIDGKNILISHDPLTNKIAVATADDVDFTSVTTGQTVMDNTGVAVGTNVKLGETGLTIVGGPSMTSTGIDAGSKVITNVAEGAVNAASKEAINGSQLNATNQNVTNLGDTINNIKDRKSVV